MQGGLVLGVIVVVDGRLDVEVVVDGCLDVVEI